MLYLLIMSGYQMEYRSFHVPCTGRVLRFAAVFLLHVSRGKSSLEKLVPDKVEDGDRRKQGRQLVSGGGGCNKVRHAPWGQGGGS